MVLFNEIYLQFLLVILWHLLPIGETSLFCPYSAYPSADADFGKKIA
jgi:hypothetical protein